VLACVEEEAANEKSLWRMLKWMFLNKILFVNKIFCEMLEGAWRGEKLLHFCRV